MVAQSTMVAQFELKEMVHLHKQYENASKWVQMGTSLQSTIQQQSDGCSALQKDYSIRAAPSEPAENSDQ